MPSAMPLGRVRNDSDVGPSTGTKRPPLGAVGPDDAPLDSPARVLQDRLAEDFGRSDDDGRRWSPRAMLGFSGAISVILWATIALTIWALR